MENNTTIWTQMRSVLLSHLYMSLITTAFGFGAFWWFLVQDNWKQLFSVICMIIYFCVLYTKGSKIARQDKRESARTRSYALKGVVLSLGIAAVTFILWALYRVTWVYMTIDGNISGYSGVVYNFAFMVWTFCYNGIMCLHEGGMFWYAHIIIYAFPALSLSAGYFAGMKGFSFSDSVISRMYEKK